MESFRILWGVVAGCVIAGAGAPVQAQNWPDVFNPYQVMRLNLQMADADWLTVQNDASLSIEVPAQFWADGEPPISVSVRRKSASPEQNGTPFKKVALKIDINEYVQAQLWHGLIKLSLESGGGDNVVNEGIVWQLNRMASGPEGYNYEHPAAMAAWVTLTINGQNTGVYLSAEQRDTRFLRNRGLYTPGDTWFYDIKSPGQLEIETGTGDSPTVQALCYLPFEPGAAGSCPRPATPTMIAQLDGLVEMHSMLTLAALDAFSGNNDAIFSAGKNFTYVDFGTASGRKRRYYPWDMDAVLGGNARGFYNGGSAYASTFLAIPQYRAQYSQIMNSLLCGPMSEANIMAFLDAVEPILTPHLEADPNSGVEDGEGFFDNRRTWLHNRILLIRSQIEGATACPPPPPTCGTSDFNGDGDFGTDADIEAFFACLAGSCCGTCFPGGSDFNGDGDFGTDADIESFFRVLGGGAC
jgi:hypothetical protein